MGHIDVIVFVNTATGYRWINGMKIKDYALSVLMRGYSDISDIRAKHELVVLMRDHAAEYNSEEMMEFLDSKGIRSYFSSPATWSS